MEFDVKKNLRHNYIVNLLDGSFFGLALGFASFTTILPLFVSTLTNSAVLIGLVPAFHNTGFQLPQLFIAKRMGKMTSYKPSVMAMTIHERMPYLGPAIIAFLIPAIGPQIGLGLTFIMLAWQGLGLDLLPTLAKPDKQSDSGDYLATFFGLQSSAANLLSSGGAIAAGVILEKIQAPFNFSLCFLCAVVFFGASWIALNMTREIPHKIDPSGFVSLPFWKSVATILRNDPGFRWYIAVRNLSQFGTMAFAFYTVFAVRQLGMSEVMVGIMTSVLLITQTIANPILGWLADRWGRRNVLEIGAAAAALSAFLAWIAPDSTVFILVFILAGIANTVFWTIGMALTLSFGTEEKRPTYVGLANTLIAPSAILAPLLGGTLADSAGYSATFATATIASLASILILHFFVHDPRIAI